MIDKKKIAKGLGAGAATFVLLALLQEMRTEINEIRERLVALETLQGDIHD